MYLPHYLFIMKHFISLLVVIFILVLSIAFFFATESQFKEESQEIQNETGQLTTTISQTPTLETTLNIKPSTMRIESSAFGHNEMLPALFTCQGQGINPPLEFSEVPEGVQSLALIVDDPDAPDPSAPQRTWVHWVVFNIDPATTKVSQDSVPTGGIQGINDSNIQGFDDPCPPIGMHRYFFKLYALDTKLDLEAGATKTELLSAMEGHILEEAQLVGLYKKS